MKVVKMSEIPAQERASGLFRGRVTAQPVLDAEGSELRVSIINFDQGAVNVFHTHTSDQVLFVLSGEGIVATEQEEVRVGPGTWIVIPAGEKHWHGATPNSTFTHVAISTKGETKF